MADFIRTIRLVNRIDDLIAAIEEVADEDNIADVLTESALESARTFFPVLKKLAPKDEGKDPLHERSSLRQHGITVEKGWEEPQIIKTQKGLYMRFTNTAPHLRILQQGAVGHNIPSSTLPYPLHFWWGSPLKWNAKDGLPAGPRKYWGVAHPGFRPFHFSRNAWRRKEGKATTQENFNKGIRKIYGPLDKFFDT